MDRLMNKLNNEILNISNLITKKYVGNNSLLIAKLNATTGKILSNKEIVNELGDYVQNIYMVGDIYQNEYYKQWAHNQVAMSSKLCQTSFGLFMPNTCWQKKGLFIPFLLWIIQTPLLG